MVDGRVVLFRREPHERILERARVLKPHGLDDVAEARTVACRQATHVPQIDVNDPPVADNHIARMRVGVEKPVVENLRRVVVEHLRPDFLQVVPVGHQPVRVADGNAVDVFHDQDELAAQLGVDLRARDEDAVAVELGELGEVRRLAPEIGLLQKRRPHLLDDGAQVEHLLAFHVPRGATGEHAHDVDVERHRGLHAGALDFNGDRLSRGQDRAMHLGKRRTAKRLRVDLDEDFLATAAEFLVERREHLIERQRIAFRLELGEFLAKHLGKDFRARRERLADLYEARAQVLEHRAELFGREALEGTMLADDADDFAHAAATGLGVEPETALGVGVGPGGEKVPEQCVVFGHEETRGGAALGRGGAFARGSLACVSGRLRSCVCGRLHDDFACDNFRSRRLGRSSVTLSVQSRSLVEHGTRAIGDRLHRCAHRSDCRRARGLRFGDGIRLRSRTRCGVRSLQLLSRRLGVLCVGGIRHLAHDVGELDALVGRHHGHACLDGVAANG